MKRIARRHQVEEEEKETVVISRATGMTADLIQLEDPFVAVRGNSPKWECPFLLPIARDSISREPLGTSNLHKTARGATPSPRRDPPSVATRII